MSKRTGPSGMTLIEIMMSVMVISLGVLGILAVIPFGMERMGRVVENDYVAAVGKKAVNTVVAQGWQNPVNWAYLNAKGTPRLYDHPWDDTELGNNPQDNEYGYLYKYNFLYPRLLDPFLPLFNEASEQSCLNHEFIPLNSGMTNVATLLSQGAGNGLMRVLPRSARWNSQTGALRDEAGTTAFLDYYFRGHDDIVYERAENEKGRPELMTEDFTGGDNSTRTIASYTGAYTWMAMMTPVPSDAIPDFTDLTFPATGNDSSLDMRVDAVVFRGRVPTDASDTVIAKVRQMGNGYAGGKFALTPILTDLGHNFGASGSLNDLEKVLGSSTHLLIIGPNLNPFNDLTASNLTQRFAEWYQIAGFTKKNDGTFEVTLVGKSTPDFWNQSKWQGKTDKDGNPLDYGGPNDYLGWARDNNDTAVKAVLFRNVRGVFTRVVPVSAN